MTRPLRRRHLVAWLVIGPGCVLVLLAAIAFKPRPPIEAPPAPTTGSGP